jgi:hypothetical protein
MNDEVRGPPAGATSRGYQLGVAEISNDPPEQIDLRAQESPHPLGW